MGFLGSIERKIKRKLIFKLDYSGERVVPTEMHGDVYTWSEHLSRYVFALRYAANKDILDVACGTGYGSALLSSVAANVVGIDVSQEAILWAKKHNSFYSPVHFLVKDIDKSLITGSFDLIVSFETVEHLSNPGKFLSNIRHCLRSKGKFIFSVPLEDPPNKFHKFRYNWKLTESLMTPILGKQIEWYSQTDMNISKGMQPKAKFALGIWTKD